MSKPLIDSNELLAYLLYVNIIQLILVNMAHSSMVHHLRHRVSEPCFQSPQSNETLSASDEDVEMTNKSLRRVSI